MSDADLRRLVRRLVLGATGGQEPTRIAYDEARPAGYPTRDQFVFCGAITDRGHAADCPWEAVLEAMTPKVSTRLRLVRPGLYERVDELAKE